eukprot:2178040-Alexandrium_andersonii.AAC.1
MRACVRVPACAHALVCTHGRFTARLCANVLVRLRAFGPASLCTRALADLRTIERGGPGAAASKRGKGSAPNCSK